MRVKILDSRQRPIADSGFTDKTEQVMILVPGMDGIDLLGYDVLSFETRYAPGIAQFTYGKLNYLAPKLRLSGRQDGPWGKQFNFEEMVFSEPDEL